MLRTTRQQCQAAAHLPSASPQLDPARQSKDGIATRRKATVVHVTRSSGLLQSLKTPPKMSPRAKTRLPERFARDPSSVPPGFFPEPARRVKCTKTDRIPKAGRNDTRGELTRTRSPSPWGYRVIVLLYRCSDTSQLLFSPRSQLYRPPSGRKPSERWVAGCVPFRNRLDFVVTRYRVPPGFSLCLGGTQCHVHLRLFP